MPNSQQISSITFFRFQGFRHQLWAFGMMQFAHAYLAKAKGLPFYKLMGSGANDGFNPYPDWTTYALLGVWENEGHARHFFKNSEVIKKYQNHTSEQWTIFMKNIKATGEWSKKNPFTPSPALDEENKLTAIITRATIKWKMLPTFWRYVPTSSIPLKSNNGLIYTKGIGEAPLVQMATFSIWKDFDSVKDFAYQSKEHQVAIEKTRKLKWYKEEMFTRFQPYASMGTWGGEKPLEKYL